MHGSLQEHALTPDTPAQPVMCSRTGPGTALDSHVSTPAPRSQRGWAPGTGSALAGMETCRAVSYREEDAAEAQSTATKPSMPATPMREPAGPPAFWLASGRMLFRTLAPGEARRHGARDRGESMGERSGRA